MKVLEVKKICPGRVRTLLIMDKCVDVCGFYWGKALQPQFHLKFVSSERAEHMAIPYVRIPYSSTYVGYGE